jgi:CheY-like chemotaxis protein
MSDAAQHQQSATEVTILIVEDDPLVAMDLAMQVEDLGYVVIGPFHDVGSALEHLDLALPDAAILDYNLGADTTSRAIAERLIEASVPVTFLSGYSGDDFLSEENAGLYSVLSKPIAAPELKQGLAGMLDLER